MPTNPYAASGNHNIVLSNPFWNSPVYCLNNIKGIQNTVYKMKSSLYPDCSNFSLNNKMIDETNTKRKIKQETVIWISELCIFIPQKEF